MIKIALGITLGVWLVIGTFALADYIATKHRERKERRLLKKQTKKEI